MPGNPSGSFTTSRGLVAGFRTLCLSFVLLIAVLYVISGFATMTIGHWPWGKNMTKLGDREIIAYPHQFGDIVWFWTWKMSHHKHVRGFAGIEFFSTINSWGILVWHQPILFNQVTKCDYQADGLKKDCKHREKSAYGYASKATTHGVVY